MKREFQGPIVSTLLLPALAFSLAGARSARGQGAAPAAAAGEMRVPVTLTGGYATDPQDHGRPVVLVAGALGVAPEVFRAAFRNVTPAPAGREPEPGQVRRNKDALLRALGPYGITNDRLDMVSNYYRYRPGSGELWPTTPAAAYATVRKGVVTGFVVTNPGSGYSSPPVVSIPGMPGVRVKVTLGFSIDFRRNGSVTGIALDTAPVPAPPTGREPGPRRGPRP